MSYKWKVDIEQHSPMIQFDTQSSQAIIRGTELKPKLDRFLIAIYGEEAFQYEFIDEENKALDYKVKIILEEEIQKFNVDKNRHYPPYFGNMISKEKKQEQNTTVIKPVFTNKEISIEFFSFHENLIEKIKDVISEFFYYNNFGTRQSKGFGCFYPKNQIEKIPKCKYYFDVEKPKGDTQEQYKIIYRNYIDILYKTLRSGINTSTISKIDKDQRIYFKSLMYLYANSKGYKWDKKKIKEELFNCENNNTQQSYLFRDMLGLSTNEDWRSKGATIKKEFIGEDNGEKIERYPSPILIKVFNKSETKFRICIISQTEVKGSQFEIYQKRMKNQTFKVSSQNKDFTIKTYPEFDIDDYLDFVFHPDKVDISKRVEKQYQKSYTYKNIESMYEKIHENRKHFKEVN